MDSLSVKRSPVESPAPMTRLAPRGFHFHQGAAKWPARGVTYGPFRPDERGQPFPAEDRIRRDFEAMREAGINAVRLYNVPDERLAAAAESCALRLLVDVPWPKHLNVYNDRKLRSLCHGMVEEGLDRIRTWPSVIGVMLGNEIPADLIRWAGTARVERFLRDLTATARRVAPEVPLGYATFPTTEFLRLDFFDFIGFNVYLHDPVKLREHLVRLRLLYPERPILLSEFGVDSVREGEAAQARIVAEGLRAAFEVGLAGGFVFAWTDEWHTGGYDIEDWSFGLVDADRRPKPALEALSRVYRSAPRIERDRAPSVTVVVATYNGGRTLRGCLESIARLHYPDFEAVVVDDGSTDDTARILESFPQVSVVRQPNRGLSAARNAGIAAAGGEIVAFTDSDCVVDPDWLDHLARDMERGGFDGIGGPNLTPPEERLAARCIALAPGHATHVLIDANEAEHVPGCNMAFRKSALLEVDGFDETFRKAGDDVDVIWRLNDAGRRVGFSPGGFVWHHRRPTPIGYLKQQASYAEADALLHEKHPHRFNDRGQSRWRGRIYEAPGADDLFRKRNVHYGVFGSAAFQCVYEAPAGRLRHWLTGPEAWLLILGLLAVGSLAPPALFVGSAALACSLAVSGRSAWVRWRGAGRVSPVCFPLVWGLHVAQPIVRGAARYWRLLGWRRPTASIRDGDAVSSVSTGGAVLDFWGESPLDRLETVRRIHRRMVEMKWRPLVDSEWSPWDLTVNVSAFFRLRLMCAEENHGAGRRRFLARLRLAPTSPFHLTVAIGSSVAGALALHDPIWARALLIVLAGLVWALYRRADRARRIVGGSIAGWMEEWGFVRIAPKGEAGSRKIESKAETVGREV
jgi:GT2 family glycosyltransferase